jgi:hypothetical protein
MAGAGVFFLVLIIGVSVGATSGGHKTQNAGPGGSPTPAPGPPGVPTPSPTAMPTLTPRAKCSGNSKCIALNQHCGKDEFCTCNEGFFNWDSEHLGFNCLLKDDVLERKALVDLWVDTGGTSWTNNSYWNNSLNTVCNWKGVSKCTYSGNVDTGWTSMVLELNLEGNNLVGTIPSSISNLTGLTCLNVQKNGITKLPDMFPLSLSTCTPPDQPWNQGPGLSIADNQIETLPPSVCALKNLGELILDDNMFGLGATDLPECFGEMKRITTFSAVRNLLNHSAVDKICKLPMLAKLDIGQNPSLNGTVPFCFSPELIRFDAAQCSFSSFPEADADMKKLAKIEEMDLNSNKLVGIPSNMGLLTGMKTFSAINNNMTGTLPATMKDMVALIGLYLGPKRIGNRIIHKAKEIARAHSNHLSGIIPAMPASLNFLNLRFNDFSGDLVS